MKGPAFFQGEIIRKLRKYIDKILKSSSPEPLGQFHQTKHNSSLGEGDSSLFQWRANSFPREDNYEITKIHWQIWIIFSRTTGPISAKLGTKHPWVKGIQVCSNERLFFFRMGVNCKNILKNFKNVFSRTTGPISPKLGTKYLLEKGIWVCSNEGPILFQGKIITKLRKYINKLKKSSSPEPQGQFQLGTK